MTSGPFSRSCARLVLGCASVSMSRIARLLRGMVSAPGEKSKRYCGRSGTAASKLSAARGDERARTRQGSVDELAALADLPGADEVGALPRGAGHGGRLLAAVTARPP